jgi:predicted methyltransferase
MPHRVPPILTPATAKLLLDGEERLSLDLGLSESEVIHTGARVSLGTGEAIRYSVLGKIAERDNSAYFLRNGSAFQVALAGRHFYKLLPTEGAPTLEIDGVRMHRTSGTTPNKDAEAKLDSLGLEGGRALDTCTGLGYTAVEAVKRGAETVITVELEPAVLQIALMNPWSIPLFDDYRIHKIVSDSYTLADGLPPSFFDFVVHDPPRHRHAGHLYGIEFHRKIHRLLRPGGSLFHYTGEPRSRYRGVNLHGGVAERLAKAGFTDIQYHEDVMGLTCKKPVKP